MKHIFIDMDGTIAEYKGPNDKIIIEDYSKVFNMYISKRPVKIVLDAIKKLYENDEYYIISAAPNERAIQEKDEWLDKYFPVKKENRYYIKYPVTDKASELEKILEKLNLNYEDVVLIDDHHDILKKVERMGIQVYHPSRIISRYEEILKK